MSAHPRIGVGVIVCRGETVLIGKRISTHGKGCWGFPGGHLEAGEDIAHCAARETQEETGLTIKQITPGPYTNDIFEDTGKHYVTLFVTAVSESGDPEVREVDKMTEWCWVTWDALPQPLFLPITHLVESGFSPFK